MKTKKNNETFRNRTELQLKLRKDEVDQMINWIKEWDEKDTRDLLINQIYKTKIEIKWLSFKLGVIKFIEDFGKPTRKVN